LRHAEGLGRAARMTVDDDDWRLCHDAFLAWWRMGPFADSRGAATAEGHRATIAQTARRFTRRCRRQCARRHRRSGRSCSRPCRHG
jgi:hypothetical protein